MANTIKVWKELQRQICYFVFAMFECSEFLHHVFVVAELCCDQNIRITCTVKYFS